MILETIKQYISDLDDTSFNTHFMSYILAVQDANIDKEVKYLINKNTLNIYVMDKVLQNTYKGLIDV